MKTASAMIFNILITKDAGLYVAHCLELDIVTTHTRLAKVKSDIIDLIKAQVDYAFSNNNLDHLYKSAPPQIWKEFYSCKNQVEKKSNIKSSFKGKDKKLFVPSSIIARTCESSCHA